MWTWRKTARFGHPEVFALIGLGRCLVARFAPVLGLAYTCPLRALAGIPCATCGMTHAFVHLAHGEVAAAFAASPLGALLALSALAPRARSTSCGSRAAGRSRSRRPGSPAGRWRSAWRRCS